MLRIVNKTGLARDTILYDAESGHEVKGVSALTIHPISADGEMMSADVTVDMPILDIIVGVRCPHCGGAVLPTTEGRTPKGTAPEGGQMRLLDVDW